jgi:RecA/RadA recombinase
MVRETSAAGVPETDAVPEGGLPPGAITEMVSPESSWRTSVALSLRSQIAKTGKVCACRRSGVIGRLLEISKSSGRGVRATISHPCSQARCSLHSLNRLIIDFEN